MFWPAICSLTVLSFYVLDKKMYEINYSGVSFALKAGLRIQIPLFTLMRIRDTDPALHQNDGNQRPLVNSPSRASF